MEVRHLKHLYNRAAFGFSPKVEIDHVNNSKLEVINQLFNSSKTISPLEIDLTELTSVNPKDVIKKEALALKLRKLSRKKLRPFNEAWVNRITTTNEALRERMTLFWANHFSCYDRNIIHVQQFNNTLREHALGNFKDFVKAISKEAAMIKYLNNKQNKKAKPNENFARELMELFTLGTGNYTETDIKESAKAFTGYNHKYFGEFRFVEKHHDRTIKTFMDKSGDFNGDDIIDIIFEQPSCAEFICTKLYKYFVNYNVNPSHIKEMTNVFFPNYNIEKLMRFVFSSQWFYNEENIGTKIKSPIDWYASITKVVPIQFKKGKQLFVIQKLLGQVLLVPPNVAGWEGHQSWIDSNTILLRLKLPTLLVNEALIPSTITEKFPDMEKSFFKTNPDWNWFKKTYKNVTNQQLEDYIINCKISHTLSQLLKSEQDLNKEDYVVQLLSIPEFQMC